MNVVWNMFSYRVLNYTVLETCIYIIYVQIEFDIGESVYLLLRAINKFWVYLHVACEVKLCNTSYMR